jgi:hypothetical protein
VQNLKIDYVQVYNTILPSWQIMKFSIDYATVFYIEKHTKFWSKILKGRDNLSDPDKDGKIVLKQTLVNRM